MRRRQVPNNGMYKFIIYKTKKLVCDSRGKPKYINNFDDVIYEIFGVNHLAKKLNDVYDNRDYIHIIDKVGVKYLMDIMNNPKMYEVMDELVTINHRINYLKKKIKTQSKKGKRDKYLVKEYNYLTNLYEKTIKFLRKRFGIKNSRTAYKRKYRGLNSIINDYRYEDDDDGFVSILMQDDDFYFNEDDDDDYDYGGYSYYDDYEDTSELDDFVNKMNGRRPKKAKYNTEPKYYDDMDEDDFDFDEDDGYRSRKDTPIYRASSSSDDEMAELKGIMLDLAQTVQIIANKNEYDEVRNSRGNNSYHDQPSDEEIRAGFVKKLSEEVLDMKKDNAIIAKMLNQSLNQQEQILDMMRYPDEDDDIEDDGPDIIINDPVINVSPDISALANKHEDVYENVCGNYPRSQPVNPDAMSVGEMVDKINESAGLDEDKINAQKPTPKPVQ